MGTRSVQTGFVGGVLSPSMRGRIDSAKYLQGLAVCENFIVLPQGPATLRTGTAYVNKAGKEDKPVRVIPFTFASDQTMVLEFGDKYVKFHTHGQTLLGDDGLEYQIESPYAAEDLFDIHYCQSMDVMTLVHPAYPPMELRRYGPSDWRFETISFGEPLAPPSGLKVSYKVVVPNGVTVTEEEKTRYDLKYKVTAVKKNDIGDEESSPSKITETKGNLYLDNATCTITWDGVEGADRYRVYKNYKGLYCFIGETEETEFIDDNYEPDAGITPPLYDDPFFQSKGISEVIVDNQGSGYVFDSIKPIEDYDISILTADHYGNYKFNHGEEDFYFVKHEAFSDEDINVELIKSDYDELETQSPITDRYFIKPGSDEYNKLDDLGKQLADKGFPALLNSYDHGGVEIIDLDTPLQNRPGSTRPYTESPGGPGSGAKVTYKTHGINNRTFYYDFQLTSGGSGYVQPYLSIRHRFHDYGDHRSWWECAIRFKLKVLKRPELRVKDSTGRGAELDPVIQDGKIVSVKIRYGGFNYTAPTITVIAATGSGAKLRAVVGKAGDYPSAVCYYEQRRAFGGTPTRPQVVWLTRSGTESDMSYTIPSQDDNRLKFPIAAQEASRITHLVPQTQLIALTNSTEYRISSGGSQPLSPDAVDAKVQAQIGASNVQPLIVNSSVVYAANRGGHLRELGYNWQSSGYTTGDLSIFAPHLFEATRVKDLALQKAPDQIVWCAMSDGTLAGLTYLPEQTVSAWHTHKFVNGSVESVAVVAEGDEDVLYLVVRRQIDGVQHRYIERMKERTFTELENAWHVDCGGEYKGDLVKEVSGLTWLEGETVSILADGCVLPQRVVKDGSVTLTERASHVVVGLPITGRMQTLPIALQLSDGSYGSGHMKNVNEVWLRVYRSSGVFVGPNFEQLTERKQRTDEPYGVPPRMMEGEISVVPEGKWSDTGQVCIQQQDPLPLTVLSISYDLAN